MKVPQSKPRIVTLGPARRLTQGMLGAFKELGGFGRQPAS